MRRLLIAPVLFLLNTAVIAETLSTQRQDELRELIYQDCGSCHGMRLTGGLGPALTQSALQGKNQASIRTTISEGRAGTPMPAWKNLLTTSEISWIADFLKDPGGRP